MSGSSHELQNLVRTNSTTSGNTQQNERKLNKEIDYSTFRQQIIDNNIDSRFLKSDILNKVDNKVLFKPILVLTCEEKGDYKNVNHHTVKLLLDNGAKANYIDTEWYGWEALHYAAYASNPNKLKVICDKLGEEKVNTLTMLSENALHILLEHAALAQTFNVSCQNGTDTKMAKIISKEEMNVIECAGILIQAKVDINHANFWNETPILIAIKRRYFEVVKLLLQEKDIDLDSCRDAVSGKTARELLRGEEGLGVLPTALGSRSSKDILFSLLKSGDEENFLKYNSGKISDLVNSLDGDNFDNSSCTPLQYCFRRGLIFWFQNKGNEGEQYRHEDITANRLVDVFCESGMAKSIQHLLENKAAIDLTLRKFEENHSVLEAAIIKGYYPIVALILSQPNYDLPYEKICDAMNELIRNHSRSIDLNNTLSVVLSRLLEEISYFTSTKEGIYQQIESKLAKLLKNGARIITAENQLLLLKFPSSLCWTSEDEEKSDPSWWCCQKTQSEDIECGDLFKNIHRKICFCSCKLGSKSILEDIDPEVLRSHLDDCVEQQGKNIEINCVSFLQKGSVFPVFETFLSSEKVTEFLNHAIFKILIMRQWENLKWRIPCCGKTHFNLKYLHLNVFFYVLFYFLLHLYVLYTFNGISSPSLFILGWICLVIFVSKELLQLVANWKLYCKEISNYSELALIVFAIITYSSGEWIDGFRVLAILSSNIVLFLLLENVPACAKYVTILRTIVFYLKYIIFYFIQFVAFAICFYILFSKNDQVWYKDLPNKIFETVILFTGNLDYMETPWKEEKNNCTNSTEQDLFHNFAHKEPFSKIIFIIFVLFLAIILQNLLLGLLVIDMGDLHKNSALAEQVKRAGFVTRMHHFFKSCCTKHLAWLFQYSEMKQDIKIIVDDNDRKALKTKEEKQNFEFILTKKVKKPNVLKKLRNYIRMKINERSCVGLRNDKNMQVIEEIIKNLHEVQELKKSK